MDAPAQQESPRRQLLADTLRKFQERGAEVNISRLLGRVRPEDVALLLADLGSAERRQVFDILSADFADAAGEVLTEMAPAQRLELLENLPPERTARLLERMPVDDAVFVLESVPAALHERLLELVDLSGKSEMHTHLAYREGSAGRIMDPEFFALPENETVRGAIAAIQEKRDLEMIFYLYVVDRDRHLVGVTSLRQLLLSRPVQTLAEIMQKAIIKVHVDTDQEEVAVQAERYDLLAVPVVDDQNLLVGIVTVDDIIDIVKEEAAEDLFKLAGSSDSELLYEERSLRVAGLRLPSLLLSLFGLLATGILLEYFQLRFPDALFLLAFVPVVMGLGGSIGSQTSTVTVRGLASGRLESGDGKMLAFLGRQVKVAMLLGVVCGALAGLAALALRQNPVFGLVVGLSLLLAILLASATGALIPLALERFGFDPAVASGPILSTANDITGILIYFGLAALLLRHLVH
ncbi:MAG: magnesium transporter [Thermoanaerobaculia bacterium]